jgi:hypothetical protein
MELGCGCDVHVVGLPNLLLYVFLFKNLKIQSRCRVREYPMMCNLCGEVRICVSLEKEREREKIRMIKMIVKCSGP